MRRNHNKRESLLPLAAQFCVTVLLLVLAGCAALGGTAPGAAESTRATTAPAASPITEAPVTTEAPETTELPATTEAPAEVPAAPDPADPWSFLGEAAREEGSYTDDCGNEYNYSYAIPCVLGDTEGAREINADIDDFYGRDLRDSLESMEEQCSLASSFIGYRGVVWKDVLTLVVEEHFPSDFIAYRVYCCEVSTGRRLTTPMLLEKMGVSEAYFLEACRGRIYECYMEEHSEPGKAYDPENDPMDVLDEQLSDEYVNLELMTYPENGDLVIVAPIIPVAGSAYYYHILPLGIVDPLSLLEEASFTAGTYTGDGNVTDYSYAIPRIAADTEGARAINEAIDDYFGACVREEKENMEGGCSIIAYSIGYVGHVWEDVLTVEVPLKNNWGCHEWGIYCYSTATGEWLTTAMVLERMGISQEEFLDTCRETFRQTFIDQNYNPDWTEEQRANLHYDKILEEASSDRYVNMELKAYPDSSGRLVVIAPIASIAGSDFYYQVLRLDLRAR